jgi:CheY-like chemotaxis protein
MHGGAIEVDSSGREGKGSVFYFTLPVLKEQPVNPVTRPLSDARQVILLVQDRQAGELIKDQLAGQNITTSMYQVDKDSDWLSWVILEVPDAVVLDFGLTSQSGWEILKQLKENPATQDLPVMFYSLENGGDCAELLELNYLMKPVSGDDLAQALNSHGLLGKNGGNGKKSILVADDDPEMLALHVRHLQTLSPDFLILQAQDGNQALALVREHRPVLVLLDLMMPELDGFGVLEALQGDAAIRSTPVIVVTGQVLTEEDMQRLNQGVSSVLSKGMFTAQETLEHISAVLERKRKPGAEIRRAVMKAMAFIQVHFADGISRSDVAAHVGLSERHLTRCFHQETGLTPITYLNRFRVQQAKELMRAGKTSITEIALDVGFSNSGYFTKVFRAETGLSPRAFIQAV